MSDLIKIGFRGAVPGDGRAEAARDFVFIDGDSIEKRELSVAGLAMDAIDLAYEINAKGFALKDSSINGGRLADTHWKALSYSCDSALTKQYGYKAVAFVNHHTHEVHIATAGTVANHHDILDDLLLVSGKVPRKLQPLKGFLDRVIQGLGGLDVAKVYQFSTSGHSLGAVVADLTGLEIASRGLSLVSSTTFENPGSEAAIAAVLKNHWLSTDINCDQLAELQRCYSVYNAKPNLINTTQAQFGQCYLLQPRTAEPTQISYALGNFIKNLQGLLGGGLANNFIKEYTGFNKCVQSVTEVATEHPLQNFQALDKQTKIAVEQWPTRWNRKLPLQRKSVSPELLKALPNQASSHQEIVFKGDGEPSHIKVLRTYLSDMLGVAAHLNHWFGGRKITKPVNFLPEVQKISPAPALAESHLQDHHPVQKEPGLGYKSDFLACSHPAPDEKNLSADCLKEQLGAFFSHQNLMAMESSNTSSWSPPYHPYSAMVACR